MVNVMGVTDMVAGAASAAEQTWTVFIFICGVLIIVATLGAETYASAKLRAAAKDAGDLPYDWQTDGL
jgi:ABC-type arginine transport system permease subunit